jgi:hypothetical protein
MLSLASVVTQGTLNPANLPNEKELNLYTFLVWGVVSTLMFRWKRLWAKKTEAKAKANAEITAKQKQALKHIVTLTTEEEMELLKQQLNKKPPKSGGQ